MSFLILDPHFFIYSYDEREPLEQKKVVKFILAVVDWAKRLNQNDHEFGISEDCITLLKRHPRSLLNRKFLCEVSQTFGATFGQINQVLVTLFSTLKEKLAFAGAMRTISPDALYFEIKQTTIAPVEFANRLPECFQPPFLQMLGELTFARAQGFFPVAAFEQIQFVTAMITPVDWLESTPCLLTSVHVEYVLASNGDTETLSNPLRDEFEILCDASAIAETQPMVPIRTLREAVETALRGCGNAVVLSRELEGQLKKSNDASPNAEKIKNAIRALGLVWLPEYRERRKQHFARNEAIQLATKKFRQAVSHDISDEGENVHNNPKLRRPRLVRYGQQEVFASFHVKVSPRIYFGILAHDGHEIVVLGHLGHLDTARYDASNTA